MCRLAEVVNGFYKTELIRRRGPWRTVEQLDARYVWWGNDQRLHGEPGKRTPMEVEAAYYADLESARPTLVSQGKPIGTKPRPIQSDVNCVGIVALRSAT